MGKGGAAGISRDRLDNSNCVRVRPGWPGWGRGLGRGETLLAEGYDTGRSIVRYYTYSSAFLNRRNGGGQGRKKKGIHL